MVCSDADWWRMAISLRCDIGRASTVLVDAGHHCHAARAAKLGSSFALTACGAKS
jgi:hypothetical protein